MGISRKETDENHEAAFQDMVGLLRKYQDKLTSVEMLAVMSNALGKLIAMQDQRKYTKEQIMEIVGKNIEVGNAQMLEALNNHNGIIQ